MTGKEKIIAISIGVGGACATDLIMKPFGLSNELRHLIGGSSVFFISSIFIIFEIVKDENEKFLSAKTCVWILSTFFIIGVRWVLFLIGVLPSLSGVSNILLWVSAGGAICVVSVLMEAFLKIGDFSADNSKIKSKADKKRGHASSE